jgi:hypothetical protein
MSRAGSTPKTMRRALVQTLERLDAATEAMRRSRPGTVEYERAIAEAERLNADVMELTRERNAIGRRRTGDEGRRPPRSQGA